MEFLKAIRDKFRWKDALALLIRSDDGRSFDDLLISLISQVARKKIPEKSGDEDFLKDQQQQIYIYLLQRKLLDKFYSTSFPNDATIHTYLSKLVAHELVKGLKRSEAFESDENSESSEYFDPTVEFGMRMMAKAFVKRLSTRQLGVLRYHVLEQRTLKETAELVGTVKKSAVHKDKKLLVALIDALKLTPIELKALVKALKEYVNASDANPL